MGFFIFWAQYGDWNFSVFSSESVNEKWNCLSVYRDAITFYINYFVFIIAYTLCIFKIIILSYIYKIHWGDDSSVKYISFAIKLFFYVSINKQHPFLLYFTIHTWDCIYKKCRLYIGVYKDFFFLLRTRGCCHWHYVIFFSMFSPLSKNYWLVEDLKKKVHLDEK